MKELTTSSTEKAIETNGKELAEIINASSQYDQDYARVYRVGKAYIYTERVDGETKFFALERSDRFDNIDGLKIDPEKWLTEVVSNFDFGDNYQIERLAWGIDTPEEIAADKDDDGPFTIIEIGAYNGYSPVSYVQDDSWNDVEFVSYADAQAWIDEAESGTYYLANNEADRPDYIIVTA